MALLLQAGQLGACSRSARAGAAARGLPGLEPGGFLPPEPLFSEAAHIAVQPHLEIVRSFLRELFSGLGRLLSGGGGAALGCRRRVGAGEGSGEGRPGDAPPLAPQTRSPCCVV